MLLTLNCAPDLFAFLVQILTPPTARAKGNLWPEKRLRSDSAKSCYLFPSFIFLFFLLCFTVSSVCTRGQTYSQAWVPDPHLLQLNMTPLNLAGLSLYYGLSNDFGNVSLNHSNSVTLRLAVSPVHGFTPRLNIFCRTGQYLYSWPQAALFSEASGTDRFSGGNQNVQRVSN